MIHHLHRLKSNHRPLAICFAQYDLSKPPRTFRFLSGWLSYNDFHQFVNNNWTSVSYLEETIRSFVMAAKRWNVEVFENILQKK